LLGVEFDLVHSGGEFRDLVEGALEASETDSGAGHFSVLHNEHPLIGTAGDVEGLEVVEGRGETPDGSEEDCKGNQKVVD